MKRVAILLIWVVKVFGANPPAHVPEDPFIYHPLFTGPLLTPETHVVQGGHINIEPYIFANTNYGAYNRNWSYYNTADTQYLSSQTYIQIGLTKFMDFAITPQFFTFWSGSERTTGVGDFVCEVDFQLIPGGGFKQAPSLLLNITEIFPLGSYRQLDPVKNNTDAIGSGSYQTSVGLVVGKNFAFNGRHFLATRYNVSFNYPAPVHVEGYNSYGGGNGTYGTVYPGCTYTMLVGLEYSLTQHWALAMDIEYQHISKTRFSGTLGVLENGSQARNTRPSSDSFSISPAIEYNWSETWGLIAGVWFTIAGRNISAFASGVVAVNYYK